MNERSEWMEGNVRVEWMREVTIVDVLVANAAENVDIIINIIYLY